jgi:hypothetical protein
MAKHHKTPLVPALAAGAPTTIQPGDIANLLFAARQALPNLSDADLGNVTDSIRRVGATLAALQRAEAAKHAAPEKKD